MTLDPDVLESFLAEARIIAKDGVLNDPTGDEILLAVAELADPHTQVDLVTDLSAQDRERIIAEYDKWEAR